MIAKTKTTKQPDVKKSTTRKKKAGGASILKYLPESLEHLGIVQQVAGVLEDVKGRVGDVKQETRKELSKLVNLYEKNYIAIEKRLHKATSEAKQQAQISMIHLLQKWNEHKEKLPAPLTKEIEKLILQLGKKAATKMASVKKAASATKKKKAAVKTKAQPKSGE